MANNTYDPRHYVKYLNTVKYKYSRKNWSSVELWNCANPKYRVVTPELINTAEPLALHRVSWLDDSEIAKFDLRLNCLAGYRLIHRKTSRTCTGPWVARTSVNSKISNSLRNIWTNAT